MSTCIFCREEGSSDEHVVPYGIGGRKTIDRVCGPCNSYFGTAVDAKLVDHPFVHFDRARLRIAGRGRIPNPLFRGTLVEDPAVPVWNVDTADGIVPQIQTRVLRQPDATGNETIRVFGSDEKEVFDAANKALERAGETRLTIEQFREQAKVTRDRPEIAIEITASTVSFYPAIVKIAYEVAWMTLGDAFLDDAVGESVRAALLDRKAKPEDLPERLTARFAIASPTPLLPFFAHTPDVHTITLVRAGAQLFASVRIFATFEALFPIAASTSTSAQKVITVDPVAGTWTEDPLDDALLRAWSFV